MKVFLIFHNFLFRIKHIYIFSLRYIWIRNYLESDHDYTFELLDFSTVLAFLLAPLTIFSLIATSSSVSAASSYEAFSSSAFLDLRFLLWFLMFLVS